MNKAAPKKMEIEKKKVVPGNVEKRSKRDAKIVEERKTRRTTAIKTATDKRKEYVTRAEKHLAEYKARVRSVIDETRKAKAANSFYVPHEAKVFLVVRIRGINNLSPTVRKILQLFRLRQLHNAVFIRVNKATINMLRKVEPYIAYGYPNHETIK
jgi:large subunit ribosomal protein L7e